MVIDSDLVYELMSEGLSESSEYEALSYLLSLDETRTVLFTCLLNGM